MVQVVHLYWRHLRLYFQQKVPRASFKCECTGMNYWYVLTLGMTIAQSGR